MPKSVVTMDRNTQEEVTSCVVRAEAPDRPCSADQFTPAKWGSLSGHGWSTLTGHRGINREIVFYTANPLNSET